MRIKARPDDASVPKANDWLETNDWIAELRDDGRDESAGDGVAESAGDGVAESAGDGVAESAGDGAPRVGTLTPGVDGSADAEITERAAIGDKLRIPIAWCEMGPCIAHHADPAALGEADIRARAIAAGWRVDALGRLACPECQQGGPVFWASHPVALWDRDAAISKVFLMAAIGRNENDADIPAGRRPA
jgi:hypothetical protein